MHIHINHGESDKSSDHSNQVKAYDYIFVHGPNGYNNYIKYLIKLDNDQLVQTGRPQLDFIKPINLDTKGKKVVIYAPTWEATHKSMRYTSIDIYGQQIVDTILDSDQYFFIYKPHPNIGANDNNVKKINNYIINRTKESEFALTITNEDVNNIYPLVDFAIFDMSSIMTDYLNVDKPFILADVFDPEVHNVSEYNVLKACNRLTNDNIDNLLEVIETEILNDPLKEKRAEIKELYLGNYKKGESIKKFLDSVSKIIEQRDREVKRLKEYR
jgi:CDP-glycerol glycerophosphotransferase (TagB/SpsB family)